MAKTLVRIEYVVDLPGEARPLKEIDLVTSKGLVLAKEQLQETLQVPEVSIRLFNLNEGGRCVASIVPNSMKTYNKLMEERNVSPNPQTEGKYYSYSQRSCNQSNGCFH